MYLSVYVSGVISDKNVVPLDVVLLYELYAPISAIVILVVLIIKPVVSSLNVKLMLLVWYTYKVILVKPAVRVLLYEAIE